MKIFLLLTQVIIKNSKVSGVLGDSVNKNSSVAAGVSEEYANQALTLLIPTEGRDDRDTYT